MAQYSTALPAQAAAGAVATTVVGVIQTSTDNEARVVSVSATSPSVVTGVATNNVTIAVRQLRAGTPVATFASITLGSGTNLPAENPVNVPLTATISPAVGDVMDAVMTQNGTGLALPAGVQLQVVLD